MNMLWRNCMSCVVTKGNSALLMICGYITGLKAGAEFKCSSNISFYLYPQTLAEINELRQVWEADVTNNFFLTSRKRVCARHSTLSLPVVDRPSRLGSRRPLKKIQCRHQRESRCVIILNLNYQAGLKCERQPYLSGVGRRCFILCVQWVPLSHAEISSPNQVSHFTGVILQPAFNLLPLLIFCHS